MPTIIHVICATTGLSDALNISPGRPVYEEDYYDDDDGPSNLEAGLAVGGIALMGAAIGAVVGGLIGFKRGRNRND